MPEWPKMNDALGTANRGQPAESGLCTLCESSCKGKCETWMSSLRGREVLYPRNFGWTVAGSGNTTPIGANYNSLRIHGYAYGSDGLSTGLSHSEDDCIFPNVSTEGEFGNTVKTRFRVPLMTGAIGSTFIATRYWEGLAVGAALVGIPIVVGENVVGVDRESEIDNGRIVKAPELDRRIETYLRYHDGYGAIIVQMNVEDTRNGVAEYLIGKYGDRVIIELKWGQGAKCIGGEIQVTTLDYALFLKNRGYIVDPDPSLPEVQEAYHHKTIRAFSRHSRLGYTGQASEQAVHDTFMDAVAHLRQLGYQRITLKTGSYGMEATAMAIRYASDAGLDLLTLDGSGGGTGMSPWNMMESWGVPSLHLHSKAYEYGKALADRGRRVVDMAFAGGLAREDQIFKALALGAPFVKLVCMGRALMIPGFVGSNIEGALKPDRKSQVHGHWDSLPKSVAQYGLDAEEIFAGYYDVQKRVGAEEMAKIPYAAIAMFTLCDKLAGGLQQFMAGARKFSLASLSRDELMAGNRETAEVTGIPHLCDAQDAKARQILGA